MAEKFLIDTSAVIKYLNGTLLTSGLTFVDKIVDLESNISFITEIELLVWSPGDPKDLAVYQVFIDNSSVIGIDEEIISQTINVRKAFKLKLPDALIAATALVNNMILIADNDADFKRVTELKYINPNQLTLQQ